MAVIVSIIVPAYQAQKSLAKCLDSLLAQTLKGFEVIVVDDGSTDNTASIVDDYSRLDERVKVFHIKNSGSSVARETGLKKAKGQYIAFVDSDDWIESDMLNEMLQCADDANADIVYSGFKYDYGNKIVECNITEPHGALVNAENAIAQLHKLKSFYPFLWNKLFKRDLFEDILFKPYNFVGEDYEIILSVLEKANAIVACNGTYYHYVQTPGSVSKSSYNNSRKVSYDMFMYWRKKLMLKYPDISSEIINYGIIEELAIIVSMGRGTQKNKDLAREIQKDIRRNLKGFIFNDYVSVVFKLSAAISAVSYKLLIFISKMRNTITKR